MPAGRPSKLTKKVMEKTRHYINGGYEAEGDMIPSNVGLADFLGVVERTLYNWSDSNPEFLQMLDACKQKQQKVLLNNGLNGLFNAAIAKLVLNKHGYHDRQEYTGADGKPIEYKHTVTKLPETDAWIEQFGTGEEKSSDQAPRTH